MTGGLQGGSQADNAADGDAQSVVQTGLSDDPQACATFAEPARAALAGLNDRSLAEMRSGDLGECSVLLGHIKDRSAGLDPHRLTPRQGLAGLFDSRSARLKAVRAAYGPAAASVTDAARDLADRTAAIVRKNGRLDTLWSETRDAVLALDAQIDAARRWLVERADAASTPPQPDAAVPQGAADTADPPHPLKARLADLSATRSVALARLSQLRATHNADCHAPASLDAACVAVEAWRAECLDALGMAGRKPRKVRPDPIRLVHARDALAGAVATAQTQLAAARARRAELDRRG